MLNTEVQRPLILTDQGTLMPRSGGSMSQTPTSDYVRTGNSGQGYVPNPQAE